jgi:hypothetical protein
LANLARERNRFIVQGYFDNLRELATKRLDIMDKTEWIYIVEEKECRLSFFFL